MICAAGNPESAEICAADRGEHLATRSAAIETESVFVRSEMLGKAALAAAAVVVAEFRGKERASAAGRSRRFGLSFWFEKDGLGSSLGAGDGRTFAGVLY